MATLDATFQWAAFALCCVYAAVAAWCAWKLVVFASISRLWTAQKSIHACIGLAAAGRAAMFLALFHFQDSSKYFLYVQITAEDAPLWFYMLDELPNLFFLTVLVILTLTWASSYYMSKRNVGYYRTVIVRGFIAALASLFAAQIAIWVLYGELRGQADHLSVVEGSLYAAAFIIVTAAVGVYGSRASEVMLAVPVLGLSSRTLLSRAVLTQAVLAGGAFSLRALASLLAAVAALTGLDHRLPVRARGARRASLAAISLRIEKKTDYPLPLPPSLPSCACRSCPGAALQSRPQCTCFWTLPLRASSCARIAAPSASRGCRGQSASAGACGGSSARPVRRFEAAAGAWRRQGSGGWRTGHPEQPRAGTVAQAGAGRPLAASSRCSSTTQAHRCCRLLPRLRLLWPCVAEEARSWQSSSISKAARRWHCPCRQ